VPGSGASGHTDVRGNVVDLGAAGQQVGGLEAFSGVSLEALRAATVFGDQVAAVLAKHTATRIAATLAKDSIGGA
jgi:hypothetical protein